MACSVTLKGLSNNCDSSMGGVKAIFLAPYAPFDGAVGTDEVITEVDTTEFKRYYTKKNVSTMTSTYTIDAANGVNYVSTELSLVFAKMDATKRLEMNALSTGDLMAIVVDANGEGYYLGFDEPVVATAGTGNSGTAKSDGNNYQLTLTDESTAMPHLVSSDIVEELLG